MISESSPESRTEAAYADREDRPVPDRLAAAIAAGPAARAISTASRPR